MDNINFDFNIGIKQPRCGCKHLGFGKNVIYTLIFRPWITCSKKQRRGQKRQLSDLLIILMCLLVSGDIHQCPGPGSCKGGERVCQTFAADGRRALGAEQCRRSEIGVEWSLMADQWNDLRPCNETRDLCRKDYGVSDMFSMMENGGRMLRTRSSKSTVNDEIQLLSKSTTSKISDLRSIGTMKGLHMVHLNVRSLLPKISELRYLCQESNVALFSCSETWLDDSILDAEIHIDNYCLLRKDRNRKGGGVCAYIRSDLMFKERNDFANTAVEAVWLDILLPKSKPILVGICYRPPDQRDFYESLDEILNVSNYVLGQELIILGDLNTDMLKKDLSVFKHFSSFCKSYALKQIIVDPTRITPKSRTIIDCILVSDNYKIFRSGVLEAGLSDHNMVYVIRKLKREAIRQHNTLQIRSLKRYNPQIFVE